jgi:hypothetical protein
MTGRLLCRSTIWRRACLCPGSSGASRDQAQHMRLIRAAGPRAARN